MEALRKNYKKIITLRQAKQVVIMLVIILFFDFLLFPMPVMASETSEIVNLNQDQAGMISGESEISQEALVNIMEFNGKLPENNNVGIKWAEHFVITAYNSEAGQTDDSPCITANNFNVCDRGVEDTIAANFLPFGSKVKIPELFGNRVFVVRDRMNRRFFNRVDVWMVERPDAINFGVKIANIEVLE
jgi:3D (Asp-Asp-Asp) domain-containing protein